MTNPRTVVITGAGSGIGFATAERFRDEGDTVFGLDVTGNAPEGVTAIECDVASKASVDAAIAACGPEIHVLANVAGVVQFGHFDAITEEQLDRVLAIDLKGPFLTVQAALEPLKATKGCVVNMSSVAGNTGQPYGAAYAAAKGGLTMMTRALAVELSPYGIRVNAICPGTVDTPLVQGVAESFPSDLDRRLSDRLFFLLPGAALTPAEVAAAIAFLASPDSRMTTGAVLALDGGMSA